MPKTEKIGEARLLTIDALRGIGAISVVVYHLAGNLTEYDWAPTWADSMMSFGNLGVPLFFVISGFVIAHSTRRAELSLGFFRTFALKRIIRLDPTYWCVLVFTLAMAGIKASLFPEVGAVYPTVYSFVAHLFYLQDLLSVPSMSPVFWTLCLEIQFYLFFIGSRLVLEKWIGSRTICELVLFAMYCLSLLQFHGVIPKTPGLFVEFWVLFYLGVVTSWTLSKRTNSNFFWMVTGSCALVTLVGLRSYLVVGLLCSLFIYYAGTQKKLTTWLVNRPLLYLGAISYSLYLVHPEIGWSTISVLKRIVGRTGNPIVGFSLFVCGIAASVIASHCLWWTIERTSNDIAKRLKYPARSVEAEEKCAAATARSPVIDKAAPMIVE